MKAATATTEAGTRLAQDLANLEAVLWRELDRYRCLCDLLLREKEILTQNRPEELPELLEQQKEILLEARALEPERASALSRVARDLGAPEPFTLPALSALLTGDERARIEKLRAALVHVVPRVDEINRTNVLLIRNSMSFISTTVRAILEENPARTSAYSKARMSTSTTAR